MSEWLGGATIDLTTVSDLDHFNNASRVIDAVDNAELALTHTISPFHSRKLFAASWPWIGRKRSDSVDNALAILLVAERLDLLTRGRLDE